MGSRWEELKVWNETGLTYRRLTKEEVFDLHNVLHNDLHLYNYYEILFEGKSLAIYSFDEEAVEILCQLINDALVQPHTSEEIKLNNLLKIVHKYNEVDSNVIEEAIKHTYPSRY